MAKPTPFAVGRKRKGQDPSNRSGTPDMVATLSVVANKLRITVPIPVVQNGNPHIGLSGGAHTGTEYPTATTYVSPGVYDCTYAHNVAAGDACTYPSRDPAIRSNNGAYVSAISKTL